MAIQIDIVLDAERHISVNTDLKSIDEALIMGVAALTEMSFEEGAESYHHLLVGRIRCELEMCVRLIESGAIDPIEPARKEIMALVAINFHSSPPLPKSNKVIINIPDLESRLIP